VVLVFLHPIGRGRARRAEGLLIGAIVAFFLLFNISFNGWHGGWGAVPRYLGPAIPFLALPVTYGFIRFFRTTAALAIVSVLVMGLLTVVDPQPPVGIATIASFPGRATWLRSPVTEYALPLFVTGRAAPILDAQLESRVQRRVQELAEQGSSAEEQEREAATLREELQASIERKGGEFALAQWGGTVSVNPLGVYESWIARGFPAGSNEQRWNSFNAGEFLIQESRLSLVPLLALLLPLIGIALRLAREDLGESSAQSERAGTQ
jgi:hypothetical protein